MPCSRICLASINAFSQCAELFVGNPENRKINSWKCYAIIQFYSTSAYIFSASPELSKERRVIGVCRGEGVDLFWLKCVEGFVEISIACEAINYANFAHYQQTLYQTLSGIKYVCLPTGLVNLTIILRCAQTNSPLCPLSPCAPSQNCPQWRANTLWSMCIERKSNFPC